MPTAVPDVRRIHVLAMNQCVMTKRHCGLWPVRSGSKHPDLPKGHSGRHSAATSQTIPPPTQSRSSGAESRGSACPTDRYRHEGSGRRQSTGDRRLRRLPQPEPNLSKRLRGVNLQDPSGNLSSARDRTDSKDWGRRAVRCTTPTLAERRSQQSGELSDGFASDCSGRALSRTVDIGYGSIRARLGLGFPQSERKLQGSRDNGPDKGSRRTWHLVLHSSVSAIGAGISTGFLDRIGRPASWSRATHVRNTA